MPASTVSLFCDSNAAWSGSQQPLPALLLCAGVMSCVLLIWQVATGSFVAPMTVLSLLLIAASLATQVLFI
jgi:hypothetical protein